MRYKNVSYSAYALLMIVIFLAFSTGHSTPVSPQTALTVGQSWIAHNAFMRQNAKSLTVQRQAQASNIRTLTVQNGNTLAYIVNLSPKGFIVIAADDTIDPILAFSPSGQYSGATGVDHTLTDLLIQDIPAQLAARQNASQHEKLHICNQWNRLTASTANGARVDGSYTASTFTTVVSPLLGDTRWGQGAYLAPYTYNSLTPNHYLVGCVAASMGMIMRYHQYPASASAIKTIKVNSASKYVSFNDAYNYSMMPDVLTSSSPNTQIQQVSSLLYDCGIAVGTTYTESVSTATLDSIAPALRDTFHYSAANWKVGSPAGWDAQITSELSNGYPVLLAIRSASMSIGHAVVCDGWGTQDDSIYLHLNFGWDGDDNAYYHVPSFNTSSITWNTLSGYVYNIRSTILPDAYEQDNTAINAKPIADEETQHHSIHVVGDVDWLALTITKKSWVHIAASGGNTGLRMTLYGPNNATTSIASVTSSANATIDFSGTKTLQPGTYYLCVSASTNSLIPTYSITQNITPTDEPVKTPVFTPVPPYTFIASTKVALSCATSGSTIRYTMNGTEPTSSSSIYSTPITVTSTKTIKAKAFKTGMVNSASVTGVFTKYAPVLTAIPVTGAPAQGTYNDVISLAGQENRYFFDVPQNQGGKWSIWTQLLTLSDSAIALYSSSSFSSPLTQNDNCAISGCTTDHSARHSRVDFTLMAGRRYYISVKGVSNNTGTFRINARYLGNTLQTVSTPVFTPTAPRSFNSTQTVMLSCTTSGAVIRYTINGSTPTETSATYSGALRLTQTTTIKARAYASGKNPSEVATGVFTRTLTATSAAPVALKVSEVVGSNIGILLVPTQSDRYYFDVPSGQQGRWRIWTKLGTLAATRIELYDDEECTNLLGQCSECLYPECRYSHTEHHSRLERTLTPGRYYLKIYGDGMSTGTYSIFVQRIPE